jgi:branched-chain amino acid transport system substrate-binding protein
LKKYLFLIIAALLVLGLVLPGCGGGEQEEEEEENIITIAVCGPMTDLQGQNHWDGANMAADEINAAGGVDIGGTKYTVELKKVETYESIEGESGDRARANLLAVIDDVDFVVGGFRTEVVQVYREVAMDAGKVFINCGAATDSLQFSVVTNYDRYKYWFKGTPYNSTFLVTSLLKMTGSVGGVLKGTLQTLEGTNPAYVKDDYKISLAAGNKLRVAILMENLSWCEGMVVAAQLYLPTKLPLTVTGTWLVSGTATDITSELSAIEATKPHIIFVAFSGSVGAVYSIQKAQLGIPAMTIGINVPGQQLVHWENTDGACEGELILDTWGDGMYNTDYTEDWFNAFMEEFGRYPVYTAGTYDAIRNLCRAVAAKDSLDSDDVVDWLEDPANAMTDSAASPVVMYYPMPAVTIQEGVKYALSEAQVEALYPDSPIPYDQNLWLCGVQSMPCIAHDLVYGPGYVTGVGTQWQDGKKVGAWPKLLAPPGTPIETLMALGLADQYGNWNFQYPGCEKLILPIGNMLNIPWDAYEHAV